jgi:gentisate 1,2-dioxygenase
VFSIPHWTLASHTAKTDDADLFVVSDKVAFKRLDLLREEYQ